MERKTRILAVDDDPHVLQFLKRALEDEGFVVAVAANGESALAQLPEADPDIILLDIRMPGLDGYQVLERIRKISNVPVLMLTGLDGVTPIEHSFELGADDYIRKPFLTEVLVARIKAKARRAKGDL